MPIINIIDFPTQCVKYANTRIRNFIASNTGFFAAPDEANLALAQVGIPHIDLRNLYQEDNNIEYFHSRHPNTWTRKKVVLVDHFHEMKSKDKFDILRLLANVPQINGKLNTEVAEQGNNICKWKIHILN